MESDETQIRLWENLPSGFDRALYPRLVLRNLDRALRFLRDRNIEPSDFPPGSWERDRLVAFSREIAEHVERLTHSDSS